MAVVRPFAALRPAVNYVKDVAALPYDVYSRQEAYEFVKSRPLSFLNIDRPETQFPEDYDMYSTEVYNKAAQMIADFTEQGVFVQDEDVSYFIYELTMNGRAQSGIVATCSIDDYANGIIKKHENTRVEKEQDRIRHVDTCNAQTGPIFLAYRKNDVIKEIVTAVKGEEALYDFVSEDGISHRVWQIKEADRVAAIQNAFAQMNDIYIADGHHRAASAVKVGMKKREAAKAEGTYHEDAEYNFFLSVLFPDEELKILPYNRVVRNLNGLSVDEVLEKIGENFYVGDALDSVYTPENKGEIGMYIGEKWYKLTAKESIVSEDSVKGLDASILQDYVLEPLFDISDPTRDDRVDFVGGIRGYQELEKRCHMDGKAAFLMYPTSISELFAVADDKKLMPPKSTWFEPKLRSGIFIHKI